MATISMKEFLEAGVHFGHQTRRWNPKMKEYIYGERNGIYIIYLQKTLKLFKEAAKFVSELGQENRIMLFVGTKRQAQEAKQAGVSGEQGSAAVERERRFPGQAGRAPRR